MDESTGFVIWLTGLPCSGKTTLAKAIAQSLRERHVDRLEVLDSTELRQHLGRGYAPADREAVIHSMAYICSLLARNGIIAVAACTSPRWHHRSIARRMTGRFVEVYLECPEDVCSSRDTNGLWQRAYAGDIEDFPGVSETYEPPDNPEVVCRSAVERPDEAAEKVIETLMQLKYLHSGGAYSTDDEEEVRKRLEGLGYL